MSRRQAALDGGWDPSDDTLAIDPATARTYPEGEIPNALGNAVAEVYRMRGLTPPGRYAQFVHGHSVENREER